MLEIKESGTILKEYVKLAKALGRLPTMTQTERHICSERQVRKYFDGLTNLQKLALKKLPKDFANIKNTEKNMVYTILGVNK